MENHFYNQRFRLNLNETSYDSLIRKDSVVVESEGLLYQVLVRPTSSLLNQLKNERFTVEKYSDKWVKQLMEEGFALPEMRSIVNILLPRPISIVNVRNLRYLVDYLEDPRNQAITQQFTMLPVTLSGPEAKEESRLVLNSKGLLEDPTKNPDYDPFEGIGPSQPNGDPRIFGKPRYK